LGRGVLQLSTKDGYDGFIDYLRQHPLAGLHTAAEVSADHDLVGRDLGLAAYSAGWEWDAKHLSAAADAVGTYGHYSRQKYDVITLGINGKGMLHAADRWKFFNAFADKIFANGNPYESARDALSRLGIKTSASAGYEKQFGIALATRKAVAISSSGQLIEEPSAVPAEAPASATGTPTSVSMIPSDTGTTQPQPGGVGQVSYALPAWVGLAIPANLTVRFADLGAGILGRTEHDGDSVVITLDDDAAGHGWYVPSADDSAEFLATSSASLFEARADGAAAGKMDMLSVLLHEFGHALGMEHSADAADFMGASLRTGERRLPTATELTLMNALMAQLKDGFGAAAVTDYEIAGNATLENGGLAGDGTSVAGWDVAGNTAAHAGVVTLGESAASNAELSQRFVVGADDRYLAFTVAGTDLQDDGTGPRDAFEVALLNGATGASEAGSIGLANGDALLNIQAGGEQHMAQGVRRIANPDGTTTYYIDLQQARAEDTEGDGTPVMLSFDLIGFGAARSTVSLRDIRLVKDPVAVDDDVALDEDSPVTLAPLGNDLPGGGDGASLDIVDAPARGTLALSADGTLVFAPDANYNGTDSFTYRYKIDGHWSNPATVRLTVHAVNDAPVAADQSGIIMAGKPLTFDPLQGAFDVEGDALAAVVVDGPAHGSLVRNADGTLSYTADVTYAGEDTLTYVVSDGAVQSAPVTLHITVLPANTAPVANDAAVQLLEDGSIVLDFTAFGSDAENDALTTLITAPPAHGTLEQGADGRWIYRPAANFFGTDEVHFKLNDGRLDSSEAVLSLTVTSVNDAPTLSGQHLVLAEDGVAIIDPLALAADVEGDSLSALLVAGPAHGSLAVDADGRFSYRPDPDYFGSDSFTYKVTDGQADSEAVTVNLTVTPVNDAPVLHDQAAALDEDGQVTLDPLASAFDVEGDALRAFVVDGPANGSVAVNADGSFTYTPNPLFHGQDSFTYKVNDGMADSNVATIRLTVVHVNHAPTAQPSLAVGVEDTALVLRWNDFAVADVDGDALSLTISQLPADGVLQVLQAGGQWRDAVVGDSLTRADIEAGGLRFVPAANASGGGGYQSAGYGNQRAHYARFGYTLSDGQAAPVAAHVDIDIAATADAPDMQLLGTTIQRQVFTTDWESAPNVTTQSTLVSAGVFEGWSLITGTDMHGMGNGLGGGKDGFEIWSTGDQMADAYDRLQTVSAASNGGSNWLELNDAGGSQFQTLGIARQVTTEKGASYSLGFDLAGRLGFGRNTTRIAVYVDNVRIASFDNTSGNSALDWQHAVASFVGNGGKQVIRIVTDASDRDMSGRGMMIDNVTLDETVQLNQGRQGGTVLLQGVQAALTDTDGSESLALTLAGLPAGTTVSDGTRSVTVSEQEPVVDITGWNTYALAITPPASFHGTLALQVSASATETATGSKAVVSRTIDVNVEAVAQVPVLTLTPSSTSVSRTIVDTSWENVRDNTYGATVVNADTLGGWEGIEVRNNRDEVFIVWGDGDRMPNASGKNVTVLAAQGAGNNWLALSNGVNSGTSSGYDSLGIERDIPTIDGATYTFSLDYAGALGLAAANTRIGVYVDGIQVGSYAGTSSDSALNWESLSFTFKGNGNPRSLRIQLEGGADTSTAKGAMIDALKVIETLPNSANVAYGFVNGTVALPAIGSSLAAGDDGGRLKTELVGLPEGAILSDGVNRVEVGCGMPSLDLSGWNLAALVLAPPRNFSGTIRLKVVATSIDDDNGSTATVSRDLTVNVLSGVRCDTPACVNPYVSYLADTAVVATSDAQSIAVGPCTPIMVDATVMAGIVGDVAPVADEDESLEEWMRRLTGTVGDALMAELMRVFR
jgi:VCBS repeat-containing protein